MLVLQLTNNNTYYKYYKWTTTIKNPVLSNSSMEPTGIKVKGLFNIELFIKYFAIQSLTWYSTYLFLFR